MTVPLMENLVFCAVRINCTFSKKLPYLTLIIKIPDSVQNLLKVKNSYSNNILRLCTTFWLPCIMQMLIRFLSVFRTFFSFLCFWFCVFVSKLIQIGEGEKIVTTVLLNGERIHVRVHVSDFDLSQPTIACSKLTVEPLEQGVKYVQS